MQDLKNCLHDDFCSKLFLLSIICNRKQLFLWISDLYMPSGCSETRVNFLRQRSLRELLAGILSRILDKMRALLKPCEFPLLSRLFLEQHHFLWDPIVQFFFFFLYLVEFHAIILDPVVLKTIYDTVGHNRLLPLFDMIISILVLFFLHPSYFISRLPCLWITYISLSSGFDFKVYFSIFIAFFNSFIHKRVILRFISFILCILCILCPDVHIVAPVQSPLQWCDVGQLVRGLSAMHVGFFGQTGLVSSQVVIPNVFIF